jgi:2-polyprenyl-3-methyl-5-hydroxy-6-metoxy-1,4-benzoquinol methylase
METNDQQLQMDQAYAFSHSAYTASRRRALPQILSFMAEHLAQSFNSHAEPISILSVGPGVGEFEAMVTDRLLSMLPAPRPIHFVGVEPNSVHRQEFEKMAAGFPGVTFELVDSRIEDFQTDHKFDCIYYMHSLYHMPGSEEALIRAGMDMLKDNGFLMITIDSSGGHMYNLVAKYTELTGYTAYRMDVPIANSDLLAEMLQRLDVPFHLLNHAEDIDVTEAFDPTSPMGQGLLAFVFQTDFSSLDPALKQQLLDFLDTQVNLVDGRKLLPEPSGTIVVPKATVGEKLTSTADTSGYVS